MEAGPSILNNHLKIADSYRIVLELFPYCQLIRDTWYCPNTS